MPRSPTFKYFSAFDILVTIAEKLTVATAHFFARTPSQIFVSDRDAKQKDSFQTAHIMFANAF